VTLSQNAKIKKYMAKICIYISLMRKDFIVLKAGLICYRALKFTKVENK